MADQIPTIYSFANATVLRWNSLRASESILLLEDGEVLKEAKGVLSEEAASGLRYTTRIYRRTSGELQLVSSQFSREITSYVPKASNSELRVLSEEEFGKLSEGFQKLYEKNLAEPVETRSAIRFDFQEIDLELREQFLLGVEFSSELQALLQPIRDRIKRANSYSPRSSEKKAELERNLPTTVEARELPQLIGKIGEKISSSHGYAARVQVDSGYREPDKLKVSFLADRYTGGTRKVLSLKQNGKPYADQRGRLVPDFPEAVGEARITEGELWSWWKSVDGPKLSDEEKLEALTALTRHLWML